MNLPIRKSHLHEVPLWVDPARSDYFITICCQQRGINQLCLPETSRVLLDSVRFYRAQDRWFPSLFLLMPDHLHMIVNFGYEHGMTRVIKAWKSYHAKRTDIRWQDDFFEHRLRGEKGVDEKAAYILQNPVRAGLVQEESEWPHVLMLD